MKLQLIARHLRDDQDIVIEESSSIEYLFSRMRDEIHVNKAEGSNWRYFIQPTEEAYRNG